MAHVNAKRQQKPASLLVKAAESADLAPFRGRLQYANTCVLVLLTTVVGCWRPNDHATEQQECNFAAKLVQRPVHLETNLSDRP